MIPALSFKLFRMKCQCPGNLLRCASVCPGVTSPSRRQGFSCLVDSHAPPRLPRCVASSWRKTQQARDGWTWGRLRREGNCRRWGLRIDKEGRQVKDGGISRDLDICQGRVGTGGRWMRGWNSECVWGMRAAGFVIGLPRSSLSGLMKDSVQLSLQQTEEGRPTNTGTVTAYRSVTMLEILHTEGYLGSN